MRLSQSTAGKAWLSQFQTADVEIATLLLDELLLVGRDTFARGLYAQLDDIARQNPSRPMALFAERELINGDGGIEAYFPGTETGRATGAGAPPIIVTDHTKEIGSEGPIANLITNYCRSHTKRALAHPGPEAMRDKRVGPIVLVTDFLGSGKRISDMLEAFGKVATLQSWRSYHLIEFHVVTYSSTARGIATVKSSSLKPKIHIVTGCPTIFDAFETAGRKAALDLCRRYPPKHKRPFGFLTSGALIAFAHGMPNNCPPVFWDNRGGWQPLFPRRGTAIAEDQFPSGTDEAIPDRARRLLSIAKTRRKLDDQSGELWVQAMVVLRALELRARTALAISARTRLPLADVVKILSFVRIAGWTTDNLRLTTLGRLELQRLRRRRKSSPVLPTTENPFYYPTQLRAR